MTAGAFSYPFGRFLSTIAAYVCNLVFCHYVLSSDELEKDILSVGITEAHEDLFMDLEPILYRWKQFDWEGHVPDRVHCGLGARRTAELAEKHGFTMEELAFICRDDLEEALPDGRTERYGIRYGELHGLEIHMIQKNVRNITEIMGRMKQLEEELTFLKRQLQAQA